MTAATTVACPDCDGLTFRLDPCRCTRYGNLDLADDAPGGGVGGQREPYRRCRLCRGAGSVAVACRRCGLRGRLRAQLVLTVANLDTGAVASHEVLPADLDPRPDATGGWAVELTPRVRELAARAGVAPATVGEPPSVRLPAAWRPDLPAAQRHELAARAVAEAARPAWRVWLGRSAAPPPVDPGRRLARLCALADLLLLDLVVEARRHDGELRWAVRYEVPGSPVPAHPPEAAYADLAAALAATDVADALAGLGERGEAAPARTLCPDPLRPLLPAATVDVAGVARRVRADCAGPPGGDGRPGAQAIWRDGRWWHTGLRTGEPVETLVEQSTGQVLRRTRTPLQRAAEPPDPPWLGAPLPERRCPDCRPTRRVCTTCGGTGRVHDAALLTLTDLRHRVVHLAWWAGTPEAVTTAGGGAGGRLVVRLPERYRLAAWAAVFGVRPEDLAEADGGHDLSPDVREGYVTLPWAGADPVAEQVAAVGPALPAARLLVTAVRPDAPPLAELLRLAHGLDLALVVNLVDLRNHPAGLLRAHGVLWSVELRPPAAPVHPDDLPCRPSPEAAVAHCVEGLDATLPETVPADPDAPVPVPRSGARPLPADPVPALLRLAAGHPDQPLTVRFTRGGCTIHRHADEGPVLLAEGDDLPAALAALNPF